MVDTLASISIPDAPSPEKQLATALRALSAVARGKIGAAEDALELLDIRARLANRAAMQRPQVGASLLRLVSWR